MNKENVLEALKKVIDVELGINIVDLGFIYDVIVDGSKVKIRMTLTVPSCPMKNILVKQVEDQVRELEGIEEVKVDLVFDPPWDPSMMSEEVRKKFGV